MQSSERSRGPGAGPPPPKIDGGRKREVRPVLDVGAVAAGGALGTTLRSLAMLVLPAEPGQVPWAIAGANLLGAFAMGVLVVRLVRDHPGAIRLRLFLLTGTLGSFTTFSALAVDLVELWSLQASAGAAGLYLAISLAGGVSAAFAGVRIGAGGALRTRRVDS